MENFISKKGLIVERTPVYWNDALVDEEINVNLYYTKSDYKSRKVMYKNILKDLEKATTIFKNTIKEIEKEDKDNEKR